jgi:NAD(P)-dependent dehydrogenase (short-subunit alcohol dehydrogenase family)
MSLDGKVAFITGGGSGIGRASAVKLAEHGVRIALADLDEAGLEETARLVEAAGGMAVHSRCDVTNADEVQAAVELAVSTFGGLDIALNNAGVGGNMGPLHQLEEDMWDTTINVNLKAVWLCMKYEVPHLLQRGGGSIINVSSVAGLVGFRNNAVYSASKHGVIGLTKSAALEYARMKIRVNALCPGFTETPMVENMIELFPTMRDLTMRVSPMRRLADVEEIADAVLFLAGDASSFITGHSLAVDGGATAQ